MDLEIRLFDKGHGAHYFEDSARICFHLIPSQARNPRYVPTSLCVIPMDDGTAPKLH